MQKSAPIDLATHPLTNWTGTHGLPDFTAFDDAAFAPVFEAALSAHKAEIARIAGNAEAPDIDNTLAALELAGDALSKVSAVFWCRAGAHTNETIQTLEREISPRMARHVSAIFMNDALFARIDRLYQDREALGLDAEASRVLEKTWKRFVRGGAQLDPDDKARLATINEELAGLGAQFGQNVLADESGWALFLDESDLAGLSDALKSAMAEAAETRGEEGRFAATLSRSIAEPFLASSERRDLREKVFSAFTKRGENGGKTDNSDVIASTLKLRSEKAKLLGYDSYAALKLDDTMAKTPEAVQDLLQPVWQKAREKAAEDEKELARLAAREGQNHAIAP
ncbi:peptidyl-dipeptidase Dcp [Nitratireductor aquibiodomus RA22]|uniref:Peptidyl-dipeptidase Dcp n=1 Tax=Nitratireductor aquibiodomus RA22 TaxID=1189611 RepID=I5BQR3_9HYPH|nr:peptidyl-dipeptidase Dcp [Nitratireductor aquibiodomus RA22]